MTTLEAEESGLCGQVAFVDRWPLVAVRLYRNKSHLSKGSHVPARFTSTLVG